MFNSSKTVIFLTTLGVAVLSAYSAPARPAVDEGSRDADKLLIIDCMLPGKIMRLGSGTRYMSARRPIKTTGADCEIRGGEYVAYDRASYATSLQVWLPEAKAGDPKAQTYVGEMFEQGLGTTPDYETAVAWYRKAAEQGYERAQMNLGAMYERGRGVEKDELQALNWYRRATGLGDDDLVLASEMEAIEAEAEELRTALAASEAEVASLKNSLAVSQREVRNSQTRLDGTLLELEEMRYRAAQAESSGAGSADVAALNREIEAKEAKLATQREELMGLRMEMDRQQAQFASQIGAQEGGEESYQAMLELEHERIGALENQVSQLTGALDLRQSELDSSNAQLAALRRQLEAQAANDEAATQASVTELTEIIAKQQAELDLKTRNMASLQSELESQQQNLASEKTAFAERERKLLENVESGSATHEAMLAEERARINSLEDRLADLNGELQLKQSNLDSGDSQLEVLRRQLETAKSMHASSEESRAELARLIDSQQADLEQKSLTISFLEQELASQKQQLAAEQTAFQKREQALSENADIAQVEQQSLMSRLEQTEQQLASYRDKLVESDRTIQSQEQEITEQMEQIASLETDQQRREMAQARALQTTLGDKNIELARAQGENARLRIEVDAMQSALANLRSQLAMVDGSATVALRSADTQPPPKPRRRLPEVDFGNYHALIIGNSSYREFPPLETPAKDAQAIATVLERKYGFKTQVLIDADRYAILETLNTYRERLTEQDNFLLYYAGHGTLDEQNDRGHWLPVDASPNNPANWISNVTITDYINTMSAKHVMVIADSCYSGTLTRGVRPSLEGGKSEELEIEFYKKLAKITSRTALTSGGTQPVMDGGGGAHSIFANSLLESLNSNDGVLQGPDLYFEVRQRVSSSGFNEIGQVPAFDVIQNTGDLGAPFFFVPG